MSNKIFTVLEVNEYLLAVNIDAISAYSIVLLRQLFLQSWQGPSLFTIHLRTVKVTAAVCLGLAQEQILPRFDDQTPGKGQSTYFICSISRRPVFLLNSRFFFLFELYQTRQNSYIIQSDKACLSRSYTRNLPSSFNVIVSTL